MGWYIGNQQVGQVTVEIEGGLSSNQAYLGLKDQYAIIKETKQVNGNPVNYYRCEVLIGVWASKVAKEAGEDPIKVKQFHDSVFIEISENDFINESAFVLLVAKLPLAVETLKPEWVGKLVTDF